MHEVDRCSSIAWFRLAEFIGRREKERALAVYRLLSYAWNDEAYAYKFGADLLAAFQDVERAAAWYLEAARLYEETDRLFAAAHVYESFMRLTRSAPRLFPALKMIALFDALGHMIKIQHHAKAVMGQVVAVYGADGAWRCVEQQPLTAPARRLLLSELATPSVTSSEDARLTVAPWLGGLPG